MVLTKLKQPVGDEIESKQFLGDSSPIFLDCLLRNYVSISYRDLYTLSYPTHSPAVHASRVCTMTYYHVQYYFCDASPYRSDRS